MNFMRRSVQSGNRLARNLALFSENLPWYSELPSRLIPTTVSGQRADFLQEDK